MAASGASMDSQTRKIQKLEATIFTKDMIISSMEEHLRKKDALIALMEVTPMSPPSIAKLQQELAAKDAEIARLKREIASMTEKCIECGNFASGDYGVICENCHFRS
jgi:predicted RNase H-like nuclease (RuvC/YqgF family)